MSTLTIRYFAPDTYQSLLSLRSWPQAIHVVLDLGTKTLSTEHDLPRESDDQMWIRCRLKQAGQPMPAGDDERRRQVAKVIDELLDRSLHLGRPCTDGVAVVDLPGRIVRAGGVDFSALTSERNS